MLIRGSVCMDQTEVAAGDPDESLATQGKVVYLRNGGMVTMTPTTTPTEISRVIGYVLINTNQRIWFDPSKEWIEIE